MDSKNVTGGGGGIKVTYIETQFVTSDEAGFKDLVQRLTGRSAPLPPAPPHRPRPCRPDDGRPRGTTTAAAGAAAGPPPQGYHYTVEAEVRPAVATSRTHTPTAYMKDMGAHDVIDMGDFFSDLFYVGASQRSDGYYGGFPYSST